MTTQTAVIFLIGNGLRIGGGFFNSGSFSAGRGEETLALSGG
jgi:hypothetical protein